MKTFCQQLDRTLRLVQNPSPSSCKASPTYPSAKSFVFKGEKTTLLSEEDAQKLFIEMQRHSELSFNFPYDGCQPRSHEMSRMMLLQGVKPLMGFQWIDTDKEPRLRFKSPQDGKNYDWTNHQAPVVLVNIKGRNVPYVIDPSTQSTAVPFEKWRKSFSSHSNKIKVQTEIGSTGQFAPGSPFSYDYMDKESNDRRKEQLERFKYYEGQADGIQQYQGDKMMELEDQNRMSNDN